MAFLSDETIKSNLSTPSTSLSNEALLNMYKMAGISIWASYSGLAGATLTKAPMDFKATKPPRVVTINRLLNDVNGLLGIIRRLKYG